MYNPYKIGKHIYLRHPTEEDVQGKWHEWLSDESITKYLTERNWPNDVSKQKEFFDSVSNANGSNRLVLSVIDKKNDKHIGVCNLSAINWTHRYADIAVIIGEKDYWKGAYALEATSLLLNIAFLRFNLLRVKGAYLKSNEGSMALLKLLKFDFVGEYSELIYVDGKLDDLVMVDMKREDWISRNKSLINAK